MATFGKKGGLGSLGDLGDNLRALCNVRESLLKESPSISEAERWGTFERIAQSVVEACEQRDLEALVRAQRDLRNKIRRPAVRRALAEASQRDGKVGADGVCKCGQCGAVIDGSQGPCIEGALCSRCALKNQSVSSGNGKGDGKSRGKEKSIKTEDRRGLRRRGY